MRRKRGWSIAILPERAAPGARETAMAVAGPVEQRRGHIMNEPIATPLHRVALDRRRVIVAALGAGMALRFGARAVLAQTDATQEAAAPVPANAVAWPKYNLNSATSEQFMAIPGAGERMTREFEEYRPYTSIGQFRGEIGKYVSPEEVAAFEAYIFVPIDPNQSDADTLQQAPGVTAEAAQVLIAGRPFDSSQAFLAALGQHASPDLAAAATEFLAPDAGPIAAWVKYNLNTASAEQLMGIPAAGERMTREFEEYRPYTSIGQFRGELGKYVSPEETADFEKYLFVPVSPGEADPDTLQQLPGVNADVAQTLIAAGPFDTIEAFLAALETTIAPELAVFAKAYVNGA
jgi:DNA uptake protein ComE-like DNA-binding protein